MGVATHRLEGTVLFGQLGTTPRLFRVSESISPSAIAQLLISFPLNVCLCCKPHKQAGGTEDPLRSAGVCQNQALVVLPLSTHATSVESRPQSLAQLDVRLILRPNRKDPGLKFCVRSFDHHLSVKECIYRTP